MLSSRLAVTRIGEAGVTRAIAVVCASAAQEGLAATWRTWATRSFIARRKFFRALRFSVAESRYPVKTHMGTSDWRSRMVRLRRRVGGSHEFGSSVGIKKSI